MLKTDFFKGLSAFIKSKNMEPIPYEAWQKVYSMFPPLGSSIEIQKNDGRFFLFFRKGTLDELAAFMTINYTPNTKNNNHIYGIDVYSEQLFAYCNSLIKQNTDNNINNTAKGEKEMKGFNIEFGSCENDNIRLSMYGLAVKNSAGEWVSYDVKSDAIINVDIFNFEGGKYLYKMPVPLNEIKPGDLLIHNRKPVYVIDVTNGVKVVNIIAGEKAEIMLTRNMFNFEYATKVVSLFDFFSKTEPSESQPFGNMLPLLMLEGGKDVSSILPFLMMQGNMKMDNPMMLYFLMKDGGNDSLLPLLLMNGCYKKD